MITASIMKKLMLIRYLFQVKTNDGVLMHASRTFWNYWSSNSEAVVRRFLKNRYSQTFHKIRKKTSVLLSFSIKLQGQSWEIFKNTEAVFQRSPYKKIFWNKQQDFRRTFMPKCDFHVALLKLHFFCISVLL